MKYTKQTIIKALLCAPLPLLLLSTTIFIVANQEFSPSAMLFVLVGHGLVYCADCVLSLPLSYPISILLNHFSALNLLSIFFGTMLLITPFFIFINWSHTGQVSKTWWKMYSNVSTLIFSLIPALSYWLFLKFFQRKSFKEKGHPTAALNI